MTLDPHFFALITDDIRNSIRTLINTFIPTGQELAAILLLIQLSYQSVRYLLEEANTSLLGMIMQHAIRYGVLIFLLSHWPNIAHFFFEVMHHCAHQILQQTESTHVLSALHHDIQSLLHTDQSAVTQKLEGLALVTRIIEAKVISAIAVLLLMIFMIIYLFIMNIGLILLGIGLVLGPLLLPFYLLSLTDFLLDGWLRFMITATLYQIVGSTTLVILNTIIKHLSLLSQGMIYNASIPIDYDMSIIILTIILCLLAILIMMQTPSIAAGLSSGARIMHNIRPHISRLSFPMLQSITTAHIHEQHPPQEDTGKNSS